MQICDSIPRSVKSKPLVLYPSVDSAQIVRFRGATLEWSSLLVLSGSCWLGSRRTKKFICIGLEA